MHQSPHQLQFMKKNTDFFPHNSAKQSSMVHNSETFTLMLDNVANTNFMHRRHHLKSLKSHMYPYGISNLWSVLTIFITTLLFFKTTSKPYKSSHNCHRCNTELYGTGSFYTQVKKRAGETWAEILSLLPFPTLCRRTRKAFKAGRHGRIGAERQDFFSDLRRQLRV